MIKTVHQELGEKKNGIYRKTNAHTMKIVNYNKKSFIFTERRTMFVFVKMYEPTKDLIYLNQVVFKVPSMVGTNPDTLFIVRRASVKEKESAPNILKRAPTQVFPAEILVEDSISSQLKRRSKEIA